MSHIFISYSKQNLEYARKLSAHLRALGFDVWIDEVIEPGDDWWRNIRKAIRECAAFVLIMTPEAEESHWVSLELVHALEYKKPIFPLLLDGSPNLFDSDVWSKIATIQFTDIRGSSLPPGAFSARLTERGVSRKSSVRADVVVTSEPLKVAVKSPDVSSSSPGFDDLLPAPFEWCPIPKGKVSIRYSDKKPQTFVLSAFSISKYPITNAQYRVFMDDPQGYGDPAWWGYSDEAKLWRRSNLDPGAGVTGGDQLPRTNIVWYDALAFCMWLTAYANHGKISSRTGVGVLLPTEQQWQRAAQGDDGRAYPWGNPFDPKLSNTRESRKNKLSPVTAYPGGASPYGVMDMGGNCWEWCLTDYATGTKDIRGSGSRVLKGGSHSDYKNQATCGCRHYAQPDFKSLYFGFRVACMYVPKST